MKKQRIIDEDLKLIPYYQNDIALNWYQDKQLVRQVDDVDEVYSLEKLNAMYEYLDGHGDCFYICYKGDLIGDVSLYDKDKIAIVICREYQNMHIGRKCVREMIRLAEEKGLRQVKAHIYPFNHQSQKMFLSLGFIEEEKQLYVYRIR